MEDDDDDDSNFPPPPELTLLDDMMDVEQPQANGSPLGDWNPRVVINRRAMEEAAILQPTARKRIGKVEGPYSREPDRYKLRTEFQVGNDTWEEIFPNDRPTRHPWQKQNGTQINWENWDLETGRSAHELLARLETHPRRCWNPECSFAVTGVVGSDLITPENPHEYWDPEWTRRTGIGTGLPWYHNGPQIQTESPVTPTKTDKTKGAAATKTSARVRTDLEPHGDNTPETKAKNKANSCPPIGNSTGENNPITPLKRKSSPSLDSGTKKKIKMDVGGGDPFW
ncbi:hypothetical protein V8F33_008687 [Rhypophila sp. PSN 637]